MEDRVREGYGALSKDTELLTPTGWLNIAEVTKETLVAQYWIDGQITFGYPTFIRIEKVEKAVHISSNGKHFDQLVGIQHAIPYISTKTYELKIRSANKTGNDSCKKYLHTGILVSESIAKLSPIERVKIAFQADGTIAYVGLEHNTIRFAFSKTRKIERIHTLLTEASIDYKLHINVRNDSCFVFSAPCGFYKKDFNWVDLSIVSAEWCRQFIEEVSYWDSTIRKITHTNLTYYSTSKQNTDIVQSIATLAGYRTLIALTLNSNSNRRILYRLNMIGNSKSMTGGNLITKIIPYDGLMYQIVMPSNMLVMRRNNAVTITGCGNHDVRLPRGQVINTNCRHLA